MLRSRSVSAISRPMHSKALAARPSPQAMGSGFGGRKLPDAKVASERQSRCHSRGSSSTRLIEQYSTRTSARRSTARKEALTIEGLSSARQLRSASRIAGASPSSRGPKEVGLSWGTDRGGGAG
jgi:hypothetical protein